MEDRIQLRVMGISYSQTQSGAYALILAQAGGPVRIPVVIGASEAQSIAMRMEGITPPRPLTHDLMANMTRAFGIALKEVFIYKFDDGVFSSEMKFIDMDREVTLDSRTSDAIALAMRVGAPIFTTREIMEETGFVLEETSEGVIGSSDKNETAGVSQSPRMPDAEEFSIEQLEATLSQLIEREEYEEASRISEILKRKRGKNHKKE